MADAASSSGRQWQGVAGAGALAALIPATGASASAARVAPSDAEADYPFEGVHQAGILTPIQRAASFVAFDVTVTSKAELASLLQSITDRVRVLTQGGTPKPGGIVHPPTDSGTLGPELVADGLTVTLSLGASIFDDRFGLSAQKPKHLSTMDSFANDDLKPEWCHGDLSLQICAHHPDTVLHALRDIAKATRGGMQVRWRQDGFVSPSRPEGALRNHFGFKDGTANPDVTNAQQMDSLVWAGSEEPSWTTGGSYQVIRLISMLVEFWDRVGMSEQELMIGRARDSGATLDKNHENEDPDYLQDPRGSVVPLTSHIRVANPRTAESESQRILRRGYNYSAGMESNGNLNLGLIFVCYQQDIDRQFIAVQKRLADEPLVDYILPFGGGYFFTVPGVTSTNDYLAQKLFSS